MRNRIALASSLAFAMLILKLLSPALIHHILSYVQDAISGKTDLAMGIVSALGLCAVNVTLAVLSQHYVYHIVACTQAGVNILNRIIYDKTLRLNHRSRINYDTGDVLNHMGVDSDAAAAFAWACIELGTALLTIAAVTTVLLHLIGSAALVAIGVFLAATAITRAFSRRFRRIDGILMSRRDRRVSQMSQILSSMRVVKYFAWERLLEQEVLLKRQDEVAAWRRRALTKSISLLTFLGIHTIASVATFGAHLAWGHDLDAPTIFACLALFSLLEHPFRQLPQYMADLSAARVSASRIAQFLRLPDKDLDNRPLSRPDTPIGISLRDVQVASDDGKPPILDNVTFHISPGESLAVVGSVGSGKTTLLLTILGELELSQGELRWQGIENDAAPRLAYVPQEAFILNANVRDNIAFGEEDALLDAAIDATAFRQDLCHLPAGLETEIGEQGVNLSGGQKQRLSLARAVMRRPGLVLLDDPLSAVDEVTEFKIIDNLIFGRWSKITRIVVTHRLSHLDRFDKVAFFHEGKLKLARCASLARSMKLVDGQGL